MNTGVQYLREHMKSDCRIHYAITNAGGVSPNVVQSEADVLYMVRSVAVEDSVAPGLLEAPTLGEENREKPEEEAQTLYINEETQFLLIEFLLVYMLLDKQTLTVAHTLQVYIPPDSSKDKQ